MKYCYECGEKVAENQKFCPNCGKQLSIPNDEQKIEKEEPKKVDPNKLVCPHCGSDDIQVQIVAENKNTGCLMVFVYVILALTIIGIPIMILILLLRGKKSVNKKYYVCQNCGRTFSPNPFTGSMISSRGIRSTNNNGPVVAIALVLVAIGIGLIIGIPLLTHDTDYVEYNQYQELNPQQLHNDYLDNEISAKDKYSDNYYYFTGEISDITEFLNDTYLEIKYKSDRDSSKTIELNAYFHSGSQLENVKKGDNVTVYCKFKQRSIENYFGTTSYSFHSCRFK